MRKNRSIFPFAAAKYLDGKNMAIVPAVTVAAEAPKEDDDDDDDDDE